VGSILYDYLTESILFNSENVGNSFANLTDGVLLRELQGYRDFCIRNLPELETEATSAGSLLRVFSGRRGVKMPERSAVDRHGLAKSVRYLKDLTPFVAANYVVKLLPVSLIFEPPRELPVHQSDNQFDDVLAPERSSTRANPAFFLWKARTDG
jgi:hypothetical protein